MLKFIMTRNKLENKIIEWSNRFVKKLENYDLKEIIEKKNLSKFNSETLKKFSEYGNWDFVPDFTILLKKKELNKNEKEYELILINRENSSIGLRSIGEIMCYNRICNPMYSFLVTEKGHSNEISYFMINENFRDRLINFNDKSLVIFSFEEDSSRVKDNSIIPPHYKKILNE